MCISLEIFWLWNPGNQSGAVISHLILVLFRLLILLQLICALDEYEGKNLENGCSDAQGSVTESHMPFSEQESTHDKRLKNEMEYLSEHPLDGIDIEFVEREHWKTTVKTTSGDILFDITFPGSYPFTRPNIKLVTEKVSRAYIIDSTGDVCLEILDKDWAADKWKPGVRMQRIMEAIRDYERAEVEQQHPTVL